MQADDLRQLPDGGDRRGPCLSGQWSASGESCDHDDVVRRIRRAAAGMELGEVGSRPGQHGICNLHANRRYSRRARSRFCFASPPYCSERGGYPAMMMQTASTFSAFQPMRAAFCAISRPEVATPPALAALPGQQHASFQEQVGCGDGGRHVGAFRHGLDAIGNRLAGGIDVQFVLGRARQGNIHRH